jgi:hypothetical protein
MVKLLIGLKDIATQQVQVAGARWEIIKLYLIANYQIFQNGEINFADNVSVISQRTLKFRKYNAKYLIQLIVVHFVIMG